MQLGIRLHDVNASLSSEMQTLEERAKKAREEGFSCVHLAYSKVIPGYTFNNCALTEGLARYTRRVFEKQELDVAVLGCYLNLAHPDPEKLKEFQSRYYGNIRVASVLGASVVGTETGAPNAQYKMDGATHSKEALETFINGLAPVVECAEKYGVSVAIEPVWKHIVYSPERARIVLDAIASPNLRIIFDPVNLLCTENMDRREEIFGRTIELLKDDIAVVHLKDFVPEGNDLKSIAAGTGMMDYRQILSFMKQNKPYIQATLENTVNENAVQSRMYLENLYAEL